ncbi:DoxX family protein [Thioclava pacifica]|uniref:DoxX family protein n=1 Tax=Thioclava pacifica DSM 10166 TaxID=1353537 RepID=A0A074JCR2_9RHOB|nr:DoxX family protein [Thioclava pacifica]KEO54324.1 hypothetical protein TP2_05195 [Thioclava pacifica DSM 10166]
MTSTFGTNPPKQGLPRLYQGIIRATSYIPREVILLAARLFPATVFWMSGRTKVDGFMIKDSTFTLFQYEYALPFIPHHWAAVMATFAEHFFPMLLILGLATRLSALALLGMTLVIQIFVYPGAWVTHGLWAVAFLTVITQGPGRFSLDRVIGLER